MSINQLLNHFNVKVVKTGWLSSSCIQNVYFVMVTCEQLWCTVGDGCVKV